MSDEFSWNRPKAIFFDAGGTLIHPHPGVGEVYAEVAAQHGIVCDAEELQRGFRRAFDEEHLQARNLGLQAYGTTWEQAHAFWKRLVRRSFELSDHRLRWEGTASQFDAFFDAVFLEFARPERYRLADGAEEVLDAARSAGIRLGLISNWDVRLRRIVDEGPLGRMLDVVTISAEVGAEKPAVAIFREACHRAGVAAGEAWHVGDSWETDVLGAAHAGLLPVWLARREASPPAGDPVPARLHRISRLAQISRIIPKTT